MQAVYRWDLGDINQYYLLSEDLLRSIDAPVHLLWDGLLCDRSDILSCINHYYNNVICSLFEASRLSIPRKNMVFKSIGGMRNSPYLNNRQFSHFLSGLQQVNLVRV